MTFTERLRAFELGLQARMDEFRCSVHLCLGQEEAPEALSEIVREQDWVFSTHRSHGHYMAKGGNPEALLAEICGMPDGVNGGFSGSQSYCDTALRFHSTAIVGGLIGAATGVALAAKLRGLDELVYCCIGDAATEQGVFWESVNYAVLHALPIIYVCENNGLSVHAPIGSRQARPIDRRASAFGCSCWSGGEGLKLAAAAEMRKFLPSFVEICCTRDCTHVSAMEDLRE